MILTRKPSGWGEHTFRTFIRGMSQLLATIDLSLYSDFCGLKNRHMNSILATHLFTRNTEY